MVGIYVNIQIRVSVGSKNRDVRFVWSPQKHDSGQNHPNPKAIRYIQHDGAKERYNPN